MKIFIDSASVTDLEKYAGKYEGITTNPTLMRAAGVKDYRNWAKILIDRYDMPISFEVISDDWNEIARQAREICSWGPKVYAKIPVMNTKGEFCGDVLSELAYYNVNITAITTLRQMYEVGIRATSNQIISVFCGRIQDTGEKVPHGGSECLWASTRCVGDVKRAEEAGYGYITLTPALMDKLPLLGKNLDQFSLDTVQQFYNDAQQAGYTL